MRKRNSHTPPPKSSKIFSVGAIILAILVLLIVGSFWLLLPSTIVLDTRAITSAPNHRIDMNANVPTLTAKESIRSAILAAFAADSHALGPHWVYDQNQIKAQLGADKIRLLNNPLSNFHSGKKSGDQTHYGTQLLASLANIASTHTFVLADWFESWIESVSTGHDYVDHSSKTVLANVQAVGGQIGSGAGFGSDATDGASLVRFLPLLAISQDENVIGEGAKIQTESIYKTELATQATELFARMMYRVVYKKEMPSYAIIDLVGRFPLIKDLIQRGLDSGKSNNEDSVAANTFKTSCDLRSGLPLIAHFIAKYDSDPKQGLENALIGNALAGGDSASRAIVIGSALAARFGPDSIPSIWITGLNNGAKIQADLDLLLSDAKN